MVAVHCTENLMLSDTIVEETFAFIDKTMKITKVLALKTFLVYITYIDGVIIISYSRKFDRGLILLVLQLATLLFIQSILIMYNYFVNASVLTFCGSYQYSLEGIARSGGSINIQSLPRHNTICSEICQLRHQVQV